MARTHVTKYIDNETPSGTINGTNDAFNLTHTPKPLLSLLVFMNGMKMTVTEDYTISGTTLTMGTAPPTNSILRVSYRY